jgi:hypothetical protein
MISTTDASTSVNSVATQLLKRFDSNKDGQLSTDEFMSLLSKLTQVLTPANAGSSNGSNGSATGTQSVTATTLLPAADPAPAKTYHAMEGFDSTKLNNPLHTTPKYVFARATQDLGLPTGDRPAMSDALPRIVDHVKQNGYPNARVTSDDKIDFGDGYGDIDVLTSWGTWWWGPQ